MKCILNEKCRVKNTYKCNEFCTSYLAIHGRSGTGGRLGAVGIPRDYRGLTFNTSPIKKDQVKAYELLKHYIKTFNRQFTNEKFIKSLYLFSEEPGTGKTTTAIVIAVEYLIVHYIGSLVRGIRPSQRPVFFFDVNEWQTLYNGFARSGIPKHVAEKYSVEYYRWEEIAKQTPFVVFDDIGVRRSSDGFRGDLHNVINYRVTNRLPTVYTSNVFINELKTIYDKRLADRIRDECVEVEFIGESQRGEVK